MEHSRKKYDKIEKSDSQKLDTVWYKEFSEMCIKTVITRLHKRIKGNINSYIKTVDAVEYVSDTDNLQAIDIDFNVANTSDELPEINLDQDVNNDIFLEKINENEVAFK